MLPNCVHITVPGAGVSYVLSVKWLSEALADLSKMVEQSRSLGGDRGQPAEASGVDLALLPPSQLIQMYPVYRNSAAKLVSPAGQDRRSIFGFGLVHDPVLGHIAIFRTLAPKDVIAVDKGSTVSAVNISVLMSTRAQELGLMVCHPLAGWLAGLLNHLPFSIWLYLLVCLR